MLNINTNYASAFASNAAKTSSRNLESAMEKLSSGSRINYAKDDAAGQAISTRLSAEIQGLQMASRNAADAQSLLDTAEGAMQETSSVLLRMRELAVQSSNGTLTDVDRGHLDAEFTQLKAEINRISDNTTFAGQELLDGTYDSVDFQVGAGAGETITVSIADIDTAGIGTVATGNADLEASTVDTASDAQNAIASIDQAIQDVATARGSLGAVSNRLGSTMSNLDQIAVNLTASQGRVQDADFAQETGNLARNQILQQAATAMVAQANASKSTILALVRG